MNITFFPLLFPSQSRLFLFLSFAFSLFLSLSLFYFLSLALYLSPSFPLSPPLPLSLSVCVSSLTRFVSGSSRATYPLSPGFQLCPPPGISRLAATRRGSLSSLEPGETPAFPPPPAPGSAVPLPVPGGLRGSSGRVSRSPAPRPAARRPREHIPVPPAFHRPVGAFTGGGGNPAQAGLQRRACAGPRFPRARTGPDARAGPVRV